MKLSKCSFLNERAPNDVFKKCFMSPWVMRTRVQWAVDSLDTPLRSTYTVKNFGAIWEPGTGSRPVLTIQNRNSWQYEPHIIYFSSFQPIPEPTAGTQFPEPPHLWFGFPEPVGNSASIWPMRFWKTAPDSSLDLLQKIITNYIKIFVWFDLLE